MVRLLIVISSMLFSLTPLWARVVRVEIHERNPILDGESYPLVGPYEMITGRVHFAVDPELGPNRIITDIGKAPRNEQGRGGILFRSRALEAGPGGTRKRRPLLRGLQPRREGHGGPLQRGPAQPGCP